MRILPNQIFRGSKLSWICQKITLKYPTTEHQRLQTLSTKNKDTNKKIDYNDCIIFQLNILAQNDNNIINRSGYDASLKCKICLIQMYKFFSDPYFHWSLGFIHTKKLRITDAKCCHIWREGVYASLNLQKCLRQVVSPNHNFT